MADKLKLIFMGTSTFAVPSLKALLDSGYDVSLVITQPDRKKGRGRELFAPPVKETALKNGLNVFQPNSINSDEAFYRLKETAPYLMIVVSYGQILKKRILELPRLGCINIHASLLPELRGAAPINWAIANGLKKTGVTSMQMDEGTDTGDILLKSEIEIDDDIDSICLTKILSDMGGELLLGTLRSIEDGTVTREKQDDENATYAPVLTKEDGRISFNEMDAKSIHNIVRGFKPWPGAYTSFKGRSIKVLGTAYDIDEDTGDTAAGEVTLVTKESFFIATRKGSLEVLSLQPQNKKAMAAADFINGYGIKKGVRFGDDK